MGNQPEGQQYKNPQVPPVMPEAKDNDFKKQGIDQGKKTTPSVKDKENKPSIDSEDDTESQSE